MNYNFIITEECNVICKYCVFPKIENPHTATMEVLQKHLPYIKELEISGYMDVQGGEIGLVPDDILEYFFVIMDTKMFVSTNGLFLNKIDKFKKYIDIVQWHVTPTPMKSLLIPDVNHDELFISKGIVHDDIDDMVEFIKSNKNIQFHYIDFEYDIEQHIEYNAIKYIKLYRKIKDLKNLSDDAKERIKGRTVENLNRRRCMEENDSILIDLVNEKICLCQRNMHVNVSLTKENLERRMETKPRDFFDLSDTTCKSCGRLYEGKTRRL